eukprot:scaffold10348_cov125-Isochrysis_galbana.AAC.7
MSYTSLAPSSSASLLRLPRAVVSSSALRHSRSLRVARLAVAEWPSGEWRVAAGAWALIRPPDPAHPLYIEDRRCPQPRASPQEKRQEKKWK